MFCVWQVLTVMLVAVAMALALAHTLELPGKMRLDRATYYAMQPIYYPGFTIGGGLGEAGGTLATLILLCLTPWGSAAFWLTLVACLGLLGMQAVYWLVTHPVNQFWVAGVHLDRLSAGFFACGAQRAQRENAPRAPEWTELRARWEYSHVARAGCALLSLVALVVAIACRP